MLTHHHKTSFTLLSSHQTTNTTMTTATTTTKIRSYDEYIRTLQEERRKIQVFHRELPLCLDLVDQAIENYKKQVCISEGEEEEGKSSNEGPVLEEFIPIKAREEDEKSNDNLNEKKNESKVDWLKSAQLWNQKSVSVKENPGSKENGHGFIPFQKIHSPQTPQPPPQPPAPAAKTESTVNGGTTVSSTVSPSHREQTPTGSTSSTAETNLSRKQEKERDSRKTRRCWSPELHRRFLMALQQLGGSHAATPKQIRELMKVDGLTNDEVKSHLQKYRLHTRRPSGSSAPSTGNAQPAQYVLVGGMWAPPQNYAAGSPKVVSASPAPSRIYVPVAAPPPLSARQLQNPHPPQERKQLQLSIGSSHSEEKSGSAEHSMGGGNAHSGSPAVTSSTETTTTSPHY